MRKTSLTFVSLAVMLFAAGPAFAHCQIPCGIYDDELRFNLLEEHITTIEKSMKVINESMEQFADHESDAGTHVNQIVRWVVNKENHADAFSELVVEYFLTQRIKPLEGGEDAKAQAAYVKKLTLLHEMKVYAMKAKQTTDLAHVEKLKSLVAQFRTAYFGKASG